MHKSEREKRKRDKQNDLFGELGNMLGMWSVTNLTYNNMIYGCTALECFFLNLKNPWCFVSWSAILFISYHFVQVNAVCGSPVCLLFVDSI